MKVFLTSLLVLFVAAAFAEKQPFERYQSIIDRQMFGPLPDDFDPNKSPNDVQKATSAEQRELEKEQEKLKSSIHFSVCNLTPEGETAVGFTDNSDAKAPKHYYLKVGESRDGWLVKEADANKATMTITKDDIEVTLTIGDNSAKGGGTTAKTGTATPMTTNGSLFRRGSGFSLSGRRRVREQEEAMRKQEEAKREEERKVKEAEREAAAAAEKAEREQERAEQRQQLLAIQEELKRAREEKAKKAESESGNETHAAE